MIGFDTVAASHSMSALTAKSAFLDGGKQRLEQRSHDKEYWLIIAHVIPFLLVIFTGAFILLFITGWAFRRFRPAPDEHDA